MAIYRRSIQPKTIKIETPKPKNGEKTFKHSGDMGDLIYSLPVIKYLKGASCLYLNPDGLPLPKYDGSRSGLDKHMIAFLKPLLEAQDYIDEVRTWSGEKVDIDLDQFRKKGIQYHRVNLCQAILGVFKVPFKITYEPWIEVKPKKRVASTVFSRTKRYRNTKIDLRPYLVKYPNSAFIGLFDEWYMFCKQVGHIKYHQVSNALEMGEVINQADLFIGNQSFPMSLAIAMHKPFIQEVYPICQNCIFQRPEATYLIKPE